MLSVRPLDPSQIKHFNDKGFVVSRGALSAEDTKSLQAWTAELSDRPEVPGQHWVYHETSKLDNESDLINRIENMYPFHDGFKQLSDALVEPVGQLLGEPAVLFKDKINFKMPGGEGFEPHQDSQAGWEDYASYFISVLVAIDDANMANGCLQVAERAGRQLAGEEWVPLTEEQTAAMSFEPVPTAPGDIIYFDSYTPHASDPNMTDTTRRIFFGTYNRLSEGDHREQYYADKHVNYPPDIERLPDREYVYRV